MTDRFERVVYRTRGGLLSWAQLRLLAEAATAQGTGWLHATTRQEIVLSGIGIARVRRLLGLPPDEVVQPWSATRKPNVMSTAPVAGLDGTHGWLTDGAFRDVLESFDFVPARSIALSDPSQCYIPACLGEISFLATGERDRWRMRLALSGHGEPWLLAGAIRSKDVCEAVRIVEQHVDHETDTTTRRLAEALEPLRLATSAFEGSPSNRYRLPDGALSIAFPDTGLRSAFCVDLCVWAARRPGFGAGLTPWGTLLIRGLTESDRHDLRGILIRHGVAETAGSWRSYFVNSLPDRDTGWLCRILDHRCPVDAGISIGVVPAGAPAPNVHVLVREEGARPWWHLGNPRCTVEYRAVASSQSTPWSRVRAGVRRRDLANVVLQAVHAIADPAVETVAQASVADVTPPVNPEYRCGSCMTGYDSVYGDPASAVPPGVAFGALAKTWSCPVCGAPKTDFAEASAA